MEEMDGDWMSQRRQGQGHQESGKGRPLESQKDGSLDPPSVSFSLIEGDKSNHPAGKPAFREHLDHVENRKTQDKQAVKLSAQASGDNDLEYISEAMADDHPGNNSAGALGNREVFSALGG